MKLNNESIMSNWLCILNRENFETVKSKLVWGVAERHKKILVRTKPGDVCAFYLIGEWRRRESAIGGIFELISETYEDRSDIFTSKRSSEDVYPYRVRLKAIKIFQPEKPFKPLIPKLTFITNKKHYAGHVMGKAMREIPEDDMKLILTK